MLAATVARPPVHGSVVVNLPLTFKAELSMDDDAFGLGYYEGSRLTHFVWVRAKGENGPYRVKWMGYENGDGLLELLALLKSLADQVYSIRMLEPLTCSCRACLKDPFAVRPLPKRARSMRNKTP